MRSLTRSLRVALAALAVWAVACGEPSEEPSLAEAAEALCEASRSVDFTEGTWTNAEVRDALASLIDELRDIEVPEALRDYRSTQIEAVEAVVEVLRDADGDAVFVPSAGPFALAYGDGFARVSAVLSEEAAGALAAAGCDLGG